MMLMDGQLSHTGFEVRCLLLSALLAVDDEADDEDMNWRQREPATTRGEERRMRRRIRMPE
jgi:hypothetical protein